MTIKILSGTRKKLGEHVFEEISKIRYEAYLEERFIKKNKRKEFSDQYDSGAIHFAAINDRDGKVIGCLSAISGKDLPSMSIFNEEIKHLINKYGARKPVELSRFAVKKEYRIGDRTVNDYGKFASLKLFKAVYRYLFLHGKDLVIISVNPKYVERYEKKYGFKTFGKQKKYPKANNNPAILMYQRRIDYIKLIIKNIKIILFLLFR